MRLLRTPMTISRKEKRCEKSFDEYYIQAQEKGQSLGFDNQELLIPKRRVSQRLDDTPATQQHHLSGKSKYRIDFYYGTIDLMVNALEKRFSTESIRLLKEFKDRDEYHLTISEKAGKTVSQSLFSPMQL